MFGSRVAGGGSKGLDVVILDKGSYITLDNGIVQLNLTSPGGQITSVSYGGVENLLETSNPETNRGYWDLNWSTQGRGDTFDIHDGTFFRIISNDGDKAEVSFVRRYVAGKSVPLNIDKRYVLLRGNSGFYSYGIYEKDKAWPGFTLCQTRITLKLTKDRFHYMAVADNIQKIMPSPTDRSSKRSEPLAYPEAVLLTNPENPQLRGEVDDKYQFSEDNRDCKVHGWVSEKPLIGFWVITPSDEFRNGGPMKRNLQSHTGPTSLAMFHSAHYAGESLCTDFQDGEEWQKVFGPVFFYMNSAQTGLDPRYLWDDAKIQMLVELNAWPYDWPASPDFPKAGERGSVLGRLLVKDKYSFQQVYYAAFAYVGLANPGEDGSWQTESKGYQFWSQADANGNFKIQNIRPGTYDVFAFVPGTLGHHKGQGNLVVHEGSSLQLGDLVYEPPRDGPTLWELGIPDRSAEDFFIPEADRMYANKLFINSKERYRQYGLWEMYSQVYPEKDLVYTVGTSDWRKDWFFMHCCRIEDDGTLKPSTWEIRFWLEDVIQNNGPYKFRLALAASSNAAIQVRVNDPRSHPPVFDTMQFGKDNSIARHGSHGLYWLWNIDIPSKLLKTGENSLFLTQRKTSSVFNGVLYDYLRLEAPPNSQTPLVP